MANGAGVVGTSASDLEEFTRRAEAKKEEFESYLERSKLMELVVEVRLSSTRGGGVSWAHPTESGALRACFEERGSDTVCEDASSVSDAGQPAWLGSARS